MASGVKVADDVTKRYQSMKMKNQKTDCKRIRLLTFIIDDKQIIVEKTILDEELTCEREDAFQKFINLMERGKCRFILYDCHYDTLETCGKEDLVFILWCSDEAPIKDKMHYASSKDCVRKILEGTKCNKTFNDDECLCMEDIESLALDKNIVSIEGKPMPCAHGPKGRGPKGHGPKGHGPQGHGPHGHGPHGHGPKGHGMHH